MAFGVLDTAMTGHAGSVDLAIMALSISIYITVFVGLMGVMHALIPIQAQHVGAGELDRVGHIWGQGVWVSLVLSVVGGAVMMFPDVWLSYSGDVDPAVRAGMKSYLQALTFALPAALMFRTVYALANAVSRPKLIMAINLIGIVLKIFLNWLLIFGNWGMPALGATGAGISSAIVMWINLGIGLWFIYHTPFYKQFGLKLGAPDIKALWSILRLGIPMGLYIHGLARRTGRHRSHWRPSDHRELSGTRLHDADVDWGGDCRPHRPGNRCETDTASPSN
jgi:MATE family multidrug resistance protein